MTKEELKKSIQDLELDTEFQDIMFDMIDKAQTVDKTLLDALADVLDGHADYLEKAADLFAQAAEEYEDLDAEMDVVESEETQERIKVLADNQEELLDDISQKIEEVGGADAASPAASVDQNLNPTVTPPPAPVDMTPPAPIQPSPVDQPTPAASQTPGEAPVGDHPSVAQDQQKLEEMQAELQNLTNQTPKTS